MTITSVTRISKAAHTAEPSDCQTYHTPHCRYSAELPETPVFGVLMNILDEGHRRCKALRLNWFAGADVANESEGSGS